MSAAHYLCRGLSIKWGNHRHIVDVVLIERCYADEQFEDCSRVLGEGDLNTAADAVEQAIHYVPKDEN